MQFVEPIKEVKKIEEMKEVLGHTKEGASNKQVLEAKRNRFLFVFGINIGLRISDIVRLTIYDLMDEAGEVREHLDIVEEKTGKHKRIRINNGLAKEIQEYVDALLYIKYEIVYKNIKTDSETKKQYNNISKTAYIFFSNKGGHLTRVQAFRILNDASKKCGIKNFGTHSLRKTFGFWHYKKDNDIVILMQLFNHSSPSVTMRYIRTMPGNIRPKNGRFFLIKKVKKRGHI